VTDPIELGNYIRFQLANLTARNGDHDFEQICFHLARVVISPDLLPGTGPVGAGGDQGRDHETFKGRRGAEQIAIVCTIQADGIVTKIRSDVEKCLEQGEPIDLVVAMVTASVPVGRRHALQKEVRAQFHVGLEVLDGEAIAALLADADHFWIASRFLGVPATMAPDSASGPAWYDAAKARWLSRTDPPGTDGDLDDITRAARIVALDDGPIADIEFWLGLLAKLANPAGDRLGRRAFYQLVYLSLRGIGTAHGFEPDLSAYYDSSATLIEPSEIEDAQVLLTLVSTANRSGHVDVDVEMIDVWRSMVAELIDKRLAVETSIGIRCELLFIRGGMHLVPPGVDEPFPDGALDDALTTWSALLDVVDDVPYFPVSRLGRLFNTMAALFYDRPGYRQFLDALDPRIERRAGRSKAAEIARDRAVALYRAGRALDALEEFHRARVGWFADDTIRGSLLALVIMISCYEELQLFLAAKLHALAAAGIALARSEPETRDLVASPLFVAAHNEFRQGNWLTASEIAGVALTLYDQLAIGPWDEEDDMRDFSLQVLAHAWGFAVEFEPSAAATTLRRELDATGVGYLFGPQSPWSEKSEAEATDSLTEQLGGAIPFSDAGAYCSITWHALGVRWIVEFPNEYRTVLASERLAATMQVLHAQLAGRDLCLLPGVMRITTTISQTPELPRDTAPSTWAVTLPSSSSDDDAARQTYIQQETTRQAIAMLGCRSVLTGAAVKTVVDQIASSDLIAKLIPGGIYDSFYAMFVPEERWLMSARNACHPADGRSNPPPAVNPRLNASFALGPTYSQETAREKNETRYETLLRCTSNTRARLKGDPTFIALVESLRQDGWLDWHVLLAIHSIASSYRAGLESSTEAEFVDAARRWLLVEEREDFPVVPESEFGEQPVREAHLLSCSSVLTGWNLAYPGRFVDAAAVEMFLRDRYRHYEDDVSHPDPFI
jgi:hypothetical protein